MDDFASDTDSDYTSYWRDWTYYRRETIIPLHFLKFKLSLYNLPSRDMLAANGNLTGGLHTTEALFNVYGRPESPMPNPEPLFGHLSAASSSEPERRRTAISSSDEYEFCFETLEPRTVFYSKLRFISSRGNEYFCEIDEDYLTDRFNLTGLNTEVQYYQYALDLVTDVFDLEVDDDMREQIEKSARHLYGLVHARYVVTTRGLAKMMEKYKQGTFGKCPRVICESQHLLPMGQHDIPHTSHVKLYCAKCEDIYNPKSSRHNSIDGAYFGTSFHNILFQVYPALIPQKTQRRYEPRIYGFRVHASAALMRWQEERREEMKERLKARGMETGFEEEDDGGDGESEGDGEGGDGEEGEEDGIDDMFEGIGARGMVVTQ